MPSFFTAKKKPSTSANSDAASPTVPEDKGFKAASPATPASPSASPSNSPVKEKDKGKKSKGYFVRDRDSKRQSSSGSKSRRLSETHPLNLPPDEIRRLSALSAMSSVAQENGGGGVGSPWRRHRRRRRMCR